MSRAAARHTISILQVHQILQGAEHRGLDLAAILRRAGIGAALLDSQRSRVTQAQYAALIRVLRRVTRDELWGLCSRPLPPGSFANACRMLVHCRTLHEALRTGFGFYRLLLADFTPRLTVHDGIASVRMLRKDIACNPRASYAERTFSFFTYGLGSWLVARRIPVEQVMYRPIDFDAGSEADRLFEAPVLAHYPWVGFAFQARWLDLPVVQTTQSLAELLQQAPSSLLVQYRDRSTPSERVRRLLRRHLGEQMPSLESVAASLAMTPQTLRRHLKNEGQGFQALKDELRRDAAIEYLTQPGLTLLDIANRLGFADASTVHRAFKGWTGQAPGVYRRGHPTP